MQKREDIHAILWQKKHQTDSASANESLQTTFIQSNKHYTKQDQIALTSRE